MIKHCVRYKDGAYIVCRYSMEGATPSFEELFTLKSVVTCGNYLPITEQPEDGIKTEKSYTGRALVCDGVVYRSLPIFFDNYVDTAVFEVGVHAINNDPVYIISSELYRFRCFNCGQSYISDLLVPFPERCEVCGLRNSIKSEKDYYRS